MKIILGVSKKHNSVWRVYGYDYNEDENLVLVTEKINPLLVWYYKLKKQKVYNNICDICGNEWSFRKKRFEKMPNECFESNPDKLEY